GVTCISYCSDARKCGGETITNPLGFSQTCVAQPSSTPCGGVCLDTLVEITNCGGCGNVCMGGRLCSHGGCKCPVSECGGVCVDTTASSANCGACGTACKADEGCFGAVCLPDYEWTRWPMPNPASAALPNP